MSDPAEKVRAAEKAGLHELVQALRDAVVDMVDARRVGDCDDEQARIDAIEHAILMRFQGLLWERDFYRFRPPTKDTP